MKRSLRLVFILVIALAPMARADVIRLLDDPHEAVQARVDVIQQARRRIDAVYFLARNDRVGLLALAMLRDASRRGVTSRLVVDATFQHIPRSVLAHLDEEGVGVRVYHPLTLRHPSWTWRRMHEKVIIVDGARYITGGRNLANSYFGLAKKNFVDRDVFVEGDSAADADEHFQELWASDDVADLHVHVSAEEKGRAAGTLDAIMDELRSGEGIAHLDTGRDLTAGLADSGPVQFLHDPLAARDGPRVGKRLEALLGSAEISIVIESPYVVPTPSLLGLLERKSRDGIRVRLLTNSLRSTDGLLPQVAYLKYRRRLLRAGVQIREYKGPDTLHAKSIVIDERIAIVGSYNLDPRSQNLNAEAMCLADDPALAQELLASIGRHEENAVVVAPHARRTRTLRIWATSLLVPFIEGQL